MGLEAGQQKTLKKILAAVADSILCIYPNPNKLFTLYSEPSPLEALRVILTQKPENNNEITIGSY